MEGSRRYYVILRHAMSCYIILVRARVMRQRREVGTTVEHFGMFWMMIQRKEKQ